jgi:hypothetical protein
MRKLDSNFEIGGGDYAYWKLPSVITVYFRTSHVFGKHVPLKFAVKSCLFRKLSGCRLNFCPYLGVNTLRLDYKTQSISYIKGTIPFSRCSTFRIVCSVPSTAVFCSESIERFPGTASKCFLKLLVTIPVAPIIIGITVHFRFHIRCISIQGYRKRWTVFETTIT